jgi:hypothetical protein
MSIQEIIGDEYKVKGIADNIGKSLDIDPDEYSYTPEEKEEKQLIASKQQEMAKLEAKKEFVDQLQLEFMFNEKKAENEHKRKLVEKTVDGKIKEELSDSEHINKAELADNEFENKLVLNER